MSQISDIKNPWRQKLLSAPASFRGVIFHVETGSKAGGRRTVVHEYPKRVDNLPYSEDMGRQAWRYQFTGYLIYKPAGSGGQVPGIPLTAIFGDNSSLRYNYTDQRDKLMTALDADDAGTLIHPVFAPGGILVMCERYTMSETRERGGYSTFEMAFVLAGTPGGAGVANTAGAVNSTAANANAAATSTFANSTQGASPL